LFFFDAESGYWDWYDFLDDVEIGHRWSPRGWYKQIALSRFEKFGGVAGYLELLRREGTFKPVSK
jgi:hypothetical protein